MVRSRIALALFLISSAAFAAEAPIHRAFNVAPGGTLTIDADVGDIRVNPGSSELLLGWEIFNVGGMRVPLKDFWALKREGPWAMIAMRASC